MIKKTGKIIELPVSGPLHPTDKAIESETEHQKPVDEK